jgi:REP element-mobilizing transposase RayT
MMSNPLSCNVGAIKTNIPEFQIRNMTTSIEIPKKCHECRKYSRPTTHEKCTFCQNLEFQESILCDLNRIVQNPENFKCFAFTPTLKSVGSSKQDELCVSNGSTKPFQNFLESDRFKYQRALAVQKMKSQPDAVFINLRYHLAWNVVHRRSSFPDLQTAFEVVNDAFFDSGLSVGSLVSLLWLAPDHVHVYLESDGEEPVETIVQEIKKISKSSILVSASEMGLNALAGNDLWDEAYFVETIG